MWSITNSSNWSLYKSVLILRFFYFKFLNVLAGPSAGVIDNRKAGRAWLSISYTDIDMHTHMRTDTHMHSRAHTHTHTHTRQRRLSDKREDLNISAVSAQTVLSSRSFHWPTTIYEKRAISSDSRFDVGNATTVQQWVLLVSERSTVFVVINCGYVRSFWP